MFTRLTALLMVGGLLFAPLARAAEEAVRPVPEGLGVNIHFTDAKTGEMEMIRDGGFRIVRMDFIWSATERQKGVYDFSAYERLVQSAESQKIRLLFILDYSNAMYDENLSPHTEEGRAGFARWAAAAAKHFAGKGILWEMWNEPNIGVFWKPEPKVGDYLQLALAVGKAIREAAPGETFVGPATSTIDMPFLEACFQGGALEYFGAVTVHPYRGSGPETAVEEYRALRRLIDRHAPAGKQIPILSGEWGYSSVSNAVTPEVQGRMLPRRWLKLVL